MSTPYRRQGRIYGTQGWGVGEFAQSQAGMRTGLPSTGPDGPVREEYARLTGLPLEGVPGGTYTGVAATWQRRTYTGDTAFIVELGGSLADGEAAMHANAILAVVALVP